jgi:hypothetical protein
MHCWNCPVGQRDSENRQAYWKVHCWNYPALQHHPEAIMLCWLAAESVGQSITGNYLARQRGSEDRQTRWKVHCWNCPAQQYRPRSHHALLASYRICWTIPLSIQALRPARHPAALTLPCRTTLSHAWSNPNNVSTQLSERPPRTAYEGAPTLQFTTVYEQGEQRVLELYADLLLGRGVQRRIPV